MAGIKSSFLEVDSKILEKTLTFEECKSDLDKALESISRDGAAPWKLVTPKPGFCVKTVDDKNNKVFINYCTLDEGEIPEPRDISEDQLLDIIESSDARDFRVPLSLQEPHEELDKSGNPATCYDVAISIKFYRKIQKSEVFKMFLQQVTFDGLKDKFDVDLDIEKCITLKNRKCVGTLRPHRIRTTTTPYHSQQPLVQEVSQKSFSGSKPVLSGKIVPKPVSASQSQTDYRFSQTVRNGKTFLCGEIHLSGVVLANDVNLELGEDRVVVESGRGRHQLDIFLPINLDLEHVQAEFSTTTKILQFVSLVASTTAP